MKKLNDPPHWSKVYPQGCKEGDEEQGFFIALGRSKWTWRSTAAICKEAKLTPERVDELIQKYWKKDMVLQNPLNEDQWGYWERVFVEFPNLRPQVEESITQTDHDDRIDKASNP